MDEVLRGIAIAIEAIILAAIAYSILKGVKLTIFDLGLKPKFTGIINVLLVVVGCLVLAFFIAHLTFLYPSV